MQADSSPAPQEGPPGEFLITLSSKENQVVKFIGEQQRILCEKIITLDQQRDKNLLIHYLSQLQRIQDYLKRLYHLPSHLQLEQHLQIYRKKNEGKVVYKLVTRFWEYPTLEDALRREAISQHGQMDRSGSTIMHFLEEFMQVLLRAGGIDFFFYTPRNLFLIAPARGEYLYPFGKLVLNHTSLAGLKLLIGHPKIIREDFCEVYPLLPPNFFQMRQLAKRQKQVWIELDVVLKKRALGFFLICFIIRKVPELVDPRMLKDLLVTQETIHNHLKNSCSVFQKVLNLFANRFKKAQVETGIKIVELLTLIFVEPYREGSHYQLPHWKQIYRRLFEENSFAKDEWKRIAVNEEQISANRYFQGILRTLWQRQPQKQYYLQREFAVMSNPTYPQTPLYFLIKINCNFHKLFRYRDACQLIFRDRFSEDASQIVIKLMKLFTDKEKTEQQTEMKISKEHPVDSNSLDLLPIKQSITLESATKQQQRLFNPFQLKSSGEMEEIQKRMSPSLPNNYEIFGKFKSPLEFLSSVSSYEHLDRESKKNIVTLTQRQIILSEFCSGIWLH